MHTRPGWQASACLRSRWWSNAKGWREQLLRQSGDNHSAHHVWKLLLEQSCSLTRTSAQWDTTSGVTRGLRQGEKNLAAGAHWLASGQKKCQEMIVNPGVVDFYISYKKPKTPRKTQKIQRTTENLKNTKYQNVSWRGSGFYIYLAV